MSKIRCDGAWLAFGEIRESVIGSGFVVLEQGPAILKPVFLSAHKVQKSYIELPC